MRKNGELIHKNESRFDLLNRVGYFPFKELRRSNQAYFISELDLFDFFQATEETLSDYSIDCYPNWNLERNTSKRFSEWLSMWPGKF